MDDLNRKKTHIAKPKLCQFKPSHDHALLLLADLIPMNIRVTTFKCFIPRNTRLTTFMVRNTRYQVNCPQVRPAAISPPFTTSRPRSAPLETSECPLPTPILSQYYYGTVATSTTPTAPTTLQSVHWSEHIIGFENLLSPEIEINP